MLLLSVGDMVYITACRDLLKTPMKEGEYRVIYVQRECFVVELQDQTYYYGDNYWLLDMYYEATVVPYLQYA